MIMIMKWLLLGNIVYFVLLVVFFASLTVLRLQMALSMPSKSNVIPLFKGWTIFQSFCKRALQKEYRSRIKLK